MHQVLRSVSGRSEITKFYLKLKNNYFIPFTLMTQDALNLVSRNQLIQDHCFRSSATVLLNVFVKGKLLTGVGFLFEWVTFLVVRD